MVNSQDQIEQQNKLTLDAYLEYLEKVRALSALTIRAYKKDIQIWNIFLKDNHLSLCEAEIDHARFFISQLGAAGKEASTINRTLSGLKGYYRYLEKRQVVRGNPFNSVKSQKTKKRLPAFLSHREIELLMTLAAENHNPFQRERDSLLLEFLYSTGCRVSELCSVTEAMSLGSKILIRGKRGKQRYLFLSPECQKKILTYKVERKNKIKISKKLDSGVLFLDFKGDPLTTRGVFYILEKYLKKAGLNRKIGPHGFRHAFATQMLNEGAGIRVVQEMLGHSSLSTTQIYTHTGIDRIKQVYREAHPHGRLK